MRKIRFNYADVSRLALRGVKDIKSSIQAIFLSEKINLDHIDYIFCSDTYLLQINRAHLHHDYLTDIITFDLSNNSSVIGEVYISVERVKENAVVHGVTFKNELLRVLFHGALHLVGYNDKTKSEITIMREKEESYLRLFEKK
jgi:rRNA maturation RNase YbeY